MTFNGVTFTQMINNNLRESSVFTEQDLTGSNIAAINQAFGYVMSVVMLYINEQSAESQFADTNVYKNINREVKALGYNPIGAQTSTLAFSLSAQSLIKGFYTIPRYSSINTGSVNFCVNEDVVFAKTADNTLEPLTTIAREKMLYQGTFVEHSNIEAAGIDNELVFLSVDDKTLIDHFNIHVYVKDIGSNRWYRWNATDSLYTAGANERVYTIRLNQNKRYELQFGNNISGKGLNQGDQIAIYYLRTDSQKGEVGVGAINNKAMVAFDTVKLRQIIADTETETNFTRLSTTNMRSSLVFANTVGSTYFSPGEGVEDIRQNAPNTFRSQYRLVHQDDYKAYVQTNFANVVHDVYVCNNTEYMDQYMRYYHERGLTNPALASRPLFNQVRFGSACNFNNLYIVTVPKTANPKVAATLYLSPALKQAIKTSAAKVKTATSEILFVDPIYIACDFAVSITVGPQVSDADSTKLTIVQSPKSIKSAALIQSEVAAMFTEYFDIANQKIGQRIDLSMLASNIAAIDGVQGVYTTNTATGARSLGIAMHTWDPMYPTSVTNVTSSFQLTNFQVAYFNNVAKIVDRIVVEKANNASTFDV